ncbi:MAG TPA: DUF29 family protein, partial [Acetobacteraceae bacterium]|nr:DUF29 family protein [Acetobacteraceae bacterium]
SNYDTDILLWSERQGALLRRMGTGERVNDQVDWENVAEEIESVGREQVHAVESLLTQALLHLLKVEAWPASREVAGWEAEALLFIAQARRRFVPSMRQKIDLAGLYLDARRVLPKAMNGLAPQPVAETCPMSLDQLLAI